MPLDRRAIEDWLIAEIAGMREVDPEQVDVDDSFVALGFDSVAALVLTGDLSRLIGVPLSDTVTWDYPTITALAQHLAGLGTNPLEQ